jgi:adenine-specific DNA-methyltransferase
MAAIHGLLKQINDPSLRSRLEEEFSRITQDKKFGLVFEEHIPECTPLYGVPVKRGSTVARKAEKKIDDVFSVINIKDGVAVCIKTGTDETVEIPVDELVSVAKFGEAIFPTLQPVDYVENAPDSSLWHTLIEADNYHALQLLEYLYPKQVDCIYIDPPYNTRANDWKYNNDYVDPSDGWKHSKWLSMMKKRLKIARNLLADDGVLITTIDDNEYAHLWMLLNEIFPEYTHNTVTIQHNPGGTQGKKFSVTNEYAIFTYSANSVIFRKPHLGGDTYNLRRWGSTSGRYEGATCFYPVILDTNHSIIGFGDILDDEKHPSAQVEPQADGTIYVWPIDKNGNEKKWRYGRETVNTVKDRMFTRTSGDRIEIILRRESEPPKTVWVDPLYNAEAHGTDLLKTILSGNFPYPKSLYAVHDSLLFAVLEKKDALVLDFFAGSGTTLHAVNLLNAEDGGHRRCIMVTNNEASSDEANELRRRGLNPGDKEWEAHGICQSITWPRTKYSITGKRDDGSSIVGEYYTTLTQDVAYSRTFKRLDFISADLLNTAAKKKQIVALIGKEKLPQSLVKADTKYIVSEKHPASILFDDSAVNEWLEALTEQDQVREFYVITQSAKLFAEIKEKVSELLGDYYVQEQVKRPMSEGFHTNVEYFRLGFLDKNSVSLGRQFKEILPLLWLKAGAIGKRPEVTENELEMLILPQNNFAILLEESSYATFVEQLPAEGIDTIYFVTNSEDAFHDMSLGVKAANKYQLYRDYVDNFVIGSRRNLK